MTFPRTIAINSPLSDLLTACEVHCVAACCQDNAFGCDAEHVMLWMEQADAPAAALACEQAEVLLKDVEADSETPIYTDLFMATWQPFELANVLRDTVTSLKKLITHGTPNSA